MFKLIKSKKKLNIPVRTRTGDIRVPPQILIHLLPDVSSLKYIAAIQGK